VTDKEQILAQVTEVDRDLRAVRQLLRRPAEAALANARLTAPQLGAMRVLFTSEGLSLKDLSKELGLAHSTVSGIVDRLEKRGLVKRQPHEADLRVTKIVVSPQARQYWRETWPLLRTSPLTEALQSATSAERAEALRGLRTLRRLLEQRSGPRA
jgi:DNA-binding MarR family transcriptional regulator